MKEDDLENVSRELRSRLPAIGQVELQQDLWPRMLRRLEEPRARFGWFESVLAALVVTIFVIFPKLLPAMLYQL